MILIVLSKLFAVISKLFALIKFIVTIDCDVNSHLFFLFFFTFSAFSPKFGKLFSEVSFQQDGFSAKWLFVEWFSAKCRALFNNCQLTERTRNSIANAQREITPKISKAELWFLCKKHRLIVLNICMKFHLNNLYGCQLTERTRICLANDQKEITPKISKAEFLCMTHRLIKLYNCMKFHLNNFNGCQLTQRTRNSIANDQREITPKYPKQSYSSCGLQVVSMCFTTMNFR